MENIPAMFQTSNQLYFVSTNQSNGTMGPFGGAPNS